MKKYIIINKYSKKAIKYKNVTAYQQEKQLYINHRLWNKVIAFDYPIQAETFINKHFKSNTEDYDIIKGGNKNEKNN